MKSQLALLSLLLGIAPLVQPTVLAESADPCTQADSKACQAAEAAIVGMYALAGLRNRRLEHLYRCVRMGRLAGRFSGRRARAFASDRPRKSRRCRFESSGLVCAKRHSRVGRIYHLEPVRPEFS